MKMSRKACNIWNEYWYYIFLHRRTCNTTTVIEYQRIDNYKYSAQGGAKWESGHWIGSRVLPLYFGISVIPISVSASSQLWVLVSNWSISTQILDHHVCCYLTNCQKPVHHILKNHHNWCTSTYLAPRHESNCRRKWHLTSSRCGYTTSSFISTSSVIQLEHHFGPISSRWSYLHLPWDTNHYETIQWWPNPSCHCEDVCMW